MSIPSRNTKGGTPTGVRTFFVTTAAWGNRNLLQSERKAQLLRDVIYDYRRQGRYLLHAFVIMPNHLHVLLSVGPEMAVEKAVQLIKGGFSFRAGKEIGATGEIWQRGFSEVRINAPEEFVARKFYIHENPVRAHRVSAADEYRFSSAFPGCETDPAPEAGAKALSFH